MNRAYFIWMIVFAALFLTSCEKNRIKGDSFEVIISLADGTVIVNRISDVKVGLLNDKFETNEYGFRLIAKTADVFEAEKPERTLMCYSTSFIGHKKAMHVQNLSKRSHFYQ